MHSSHRVGGWEEGGRAAPRNHGPTFPLRLTSYEKVNNTINWQIFLYWNYAKLGVCLAVCWHVPMPSMSEAQRVPAPAHLHERELYAQRAQPHVRPSRRAHLTKTLICAHLALLLLLSCCCNCHNASASSSHSSYALWVPCLPSFWSTTTR
jgi:hypothetical protein